MRCAGLAKAHKLLHVAPEVNTSPPESVIEMRAAFICQPCGRDMGAAVSVQLSDNTETRPASDVLIVMTIPRSAHPATPLGIAAHRCPQPRRFRLCCGDPRLARTRRRARMARGMGTRRTDSRYARLCIKRSLEPAAPHSGTASRRSNITALGPSRSDRRLTSWALLMLAPTQNGARHARHMICSLLVSYPPRLFTARTHACPEKNARHRPIVLARRCPDRIISGLRARSRRS